MYFSISGYNSSHYGALPSFEDFSSFLTFASVILMSSSLLRFICVVVFPWLLNSEMLQQFLEFNSTQSSVHKTLVVVWILDIEKNLLCCFCRLQCDVISRFGRCLQLNLRQDINYKTDLLSEHLTIATRLALSTS